MTDLPALAVKDGKPVTTSLQVAEHFAKRHDNVLRDIEQILAQLIDSSGNLKIEGAGEPAQSHASFGERNFLRTEYETQNNLGFMVKNPMYEMTRDGFTLLAMGFTGKAALEWKIKYINAFNQMEAELSRRAARVQGGGSIHCFRVTLDEWVTATHAMRNKEEEMKRIRLILKIEREALEGRR
jgi:Rha family phage regulatory protein